MSAPLVEILLATWNGERFLPAQLASLDAQSYPLIRVLARDDGSSDGTPRLLDEWARRRAGRVRILSDGRGNLGAAANFAALIAASTARYLMFCDQDDVWDGDKVVFTLASMLRAERQAQGAPILVHTDLRLIDEEGRELGSSAWRRGRLHPSPRTRLARALAHNDGVTGCAAMINRRLAELATPLPAGVVMHDWYLLLLAIAFGRRIAIPRATIRYRLHGANAVGLASRDAAYAAMVWRRAKRERIFAQAQAQANALAVAQAHRLTPPQRAVIAAFAGLDGLGWIDRRLAIRKHGFWKGDVARNLALLALA